MLERDVKRPIKEREGENIRPKRGWHRRGGGCIMTLHQTDGGAQSRRPTVFSSTISGWSLICLMSWCREWGQG